MRIETEQLIIRSLKTEDAASIIEMALDEKATFHSS